MKKTKINNFEQITGQCYLTMHTHFLIKKELRPHHQIKCSWVLYTSKEKFGLYINYLIDLDLFFEMLSLMTLKLKIYDIV